VVQNLASSFENVTVYEYCTEGSAASHICMPDRFVEYCMLCALAAVVSVPPENVSVSVAQLPLLAPLATLYCCCAVSPVAAVTVSVPLAPAPTEVSVHDAW
jgi:hypothetical protein